VRAALELIDEGGLGALTMRRLGSALGVEAMSLYKHVANKEAILDGIRELLLADFAASLPSEPADGWREDLARFARAYRALGRAHPEAFALLASAPGRAYVAGGDIAEPGLRRLMDAGLDRDTAIRAQRSVVRYVLGTSLLERAAEDAPPPVPPDELEALAAERPLVGALMRSLGPASDAAQFDFGLEALLGGIGLLIAEAAGPGDA
jgi:AcrR family transcriptional regulator